MQCLISEVKT